MRIGDPSMWPVIGDIEGVRLGKNQVKIQHNARCRARSSDTETETSRRGGRRESENKN